MRYSLPGFDDSAWQTVRLPWKTPLQPTRFFWLRRSIDLPPGAAQANVALTLGAISETYEVYVNGALAGATGGLTLGQARIARPRVFDLPPATGPIHIALRVWRHGGLGFAEWEMPDAGPYRLTSAAIAPRSAGQAAIDNKGVRSSAVAITGGICVVLVALLFTLWAGNRGRTEFFYLSVFLALATYRDSLVALSISPDSTPWVSGPPTALGPFIFAGAPLAALGMLSMAALGIRKRWIVIALWLGALANIVPETLAVDGWFGLLLNLAILVWPWKLWPRKPVDSTARPALSETLMIRLALLATLAFTARFNRYAPIPFLFSVPQSFDIGRYHWHIEEVSRILLSVVILILLLRRMNRDRHEGQRLATELQAARIVQQLLIGAGAIDGGPYAVEAEYRPAQEVGGDFYQVLPLEHGEMLIAVGDVSGKGLKAAMVVSLVVGALRSLRQLPPARLLGEVNRTLADSFQGGFVTCVVARFDANGSVILANAGHLPPYLDGIERATEPGLPLGIAADSEYVDTRCGIAPGGSLTFVTDGVVEAADRAGSLFGFDRTTEISTKPARLIAETAKAWGQNDDITVVTVRRNA